jgi:nicotinate phosphoribosyltransferase
VLEFGQRRTHPQAAVDASYAAYLGGCDATSNLAATRRYGVPSVGTMDHFAVQAAEQLGIPVKASEGRFFARFCELFPHAATMLVDTYDTWQGIATAVQATRGGCTGIRLDSGVTVETVRRAKALLAELGASHVKVIASDGLTEQRVLELAAAGADGFGVGENITCSPDAATGIGAVGKLVLNGYGKLTMKLARGTGKATLPGLLQAYRFADHDLLAMQQEPPPAGAQPLLVPLWRGRSLVTALPTLALSRAAVQKQIAALPPHLRALEVVAPRQGSLDSSPRPWPIVISDRLRDTVIHLIADASA